MHNTDLKKTIRTFLIKKVLNNTFQICNLMKSLLYNNLNDILGDLRKIPEMGIFPYFAS